MNNKVDYIKDIIEQDSWIVGGENFDEDLHFSSFYIRQSSKKYLSRIIKTGYHTIIAVFLNFNETYYITKSECERVAEKLLKKIKKRPDWINTIIILIYQRCTELANVFTGYDFYTDFSKLSNMQIMKLYKKHLFAHLELYEIARIPEALDRGVGVFTSYLRNYLRKQCKTLNEAEINELFYKLTSPLKPSIFQEEKFELIEIAKNIEAIEGQKELFKNIDQRLFLKVDLNILRKIAAHRDKWGILDYHGYRHPKPSELEHYVERIGKYLNHQVQWKNREEYTKIVKTIKSEQNALYSKYNIDQMHQKLFKLYGKIGIAKLFRRFIQLRNFYFLDKLIHQIALRTDYKEGIIRNLLPEEIEDLINGRLSIDENIMNRMKFVVYIIHGEDEKIFSGIEYKWIKEKLDLKSKQITVDANELYGIPVSLGYVEGICKIIIRPQDAINKSFKNGEILISESTDPDLVDLMSKAGGVVTQQGGVTSHASIICRELNKPALVGVRNLLDMVSDGDRLILDAYKGTIVIAKKSRKCKLVIKPDEIQDQDPKLLSRIGNKALSLGRLKNAKFVIPQFFVIPTNVIYKNINKKVLCAENLDISHNLVEEINNACSEFITEMAVIRSSFLVEDDKYISKAGYFPTWINIEKTSIVEHFKKYLCELYRKFGEIPEGGIIIQEMINGEFSGVCFTVNPVSSNMNTMIIEIVRKLNVKLTDGTKTPDVSIEISKNDFDILDRKQHTQEDLLTGQQIFDLAKTSIEIERYFNYPQDIEWTIRKGKFFVLQSRPITTIKEK